MVEVDVDVARDAAGRGRHPVRLHRARPDLTASDVPPFGFRMQEPGRRKAMDLMALRALRESRTDVEALDLTAERLRHLQDAFTEAADRAHTTMNRYVRRDDAKPPHPVRPEDQQAHRPQQPGPHRGREAGH
ncbi:hypothetical protein ACFW5P_35790 [Streptomyces rochei]|uniref:hypothetical protein n=1 Tax=Streptomyces rochei TaxID=1928 RepID=UPI00363E8FB0